MAAKYHFLRALPRIDADPDPTTLGAGVTKMVAMVRDAWTGAPAPKLRLLPTRITLDRVRELAPGSTHLPLGVNEKALVPVGLDVDVGRDPHLLIFGDGRSGKSTLRSWWTGKEVFVVDDDELVATSQGNPLEPLLPLLAQAVDIGLHVVLASRSGGAGASTTPSSRP